jgi:hypothetical protein
MNATAPTPRPRIFVNTSGFSAAPASEVGLEEAIPFGGPEASRCSRRKLPLIGHRSNVDAPQLRGYEEVEIQ